MGVSNLFFIHSGGVADGGLAVYFGVEVAWGDFEANKLHVGAVGFDVGSGPVIMGETYVGRWACYRPTLPPPLLPLPQLAYISLWIGCCVCRLSWQRGCAGGVVRVRYCDSPWWDEFLDSYQTPTTPATLLLSLSRHLPLVEVPARNVSQGPDVWFPI